MFSYFVVLDGHVCSRKEDKEATKRNLILTRRAQSADQESRRVEELVRPGHVTAVKSSAVKDP